MQFYFTELQDTGVQKWFGWILAGIPGLSTVPHHLSFTMEKLWHNNKQFMCSFLLLESSQQAVLMWRAAGQRHRKDPQCRGIKQGSNTQFLQKAEIPLSRKSRAEIKDYCTSLMCVAFPGINPTPPAEWKDIWTQTGLFWLHQADELCINFRKCLANELVRYPERDELSRGLCVSPSRYDWAELKEQKQLRSLSEQSGEEITTAAESCNGGAPCPPGSPGPSLLLLLLLLYSLISGLPKKMSVLCGGSFTWIRNYLKIGSSWEVGPNFCPNEMD